MEEPNVATPVNGLLPLQQRRLLLILPPGLHRAPNGLVCRLPNLVQCVQAFAPRAKPGVIRRQAQCWLQEDGVAIGAVPALLWLIAGVHIDTEWWAQTVHVWDAQLAAAAGSAVIDASDDSDAEAEAGAMQRLQARVVQLEGMNLALTGKLRKAGKQIWHLKRKVGKAHRHAINTTALLRSGETQRSGWVVVDTSISACIGAAQEFGTCLQQHAWCFTVGGFARLDCQPLRVPLRFRPATHSAFLLPTDLLKQRAWQLQLCSAPLAPGLRCQI